MVKRITLLILAFSLIYLALYWITFSPGGMQGTAKFLQGASMAVFKTVLPKAYFSSQIEKEDDKTIYNIGFCSKPELERLTQEARNQGKTTLDFELKEVKFLVDYFTIPYLFLLSLTLVTTLPWKQKLLAVLWGSLLFVAFYLLKMFLFTLSHISEASLGIYELGPAWEERLRGVLAIMEINFSFFAAMVIWVLVAFKDNNWREVLFR